MDQRRIDVSFRIEIARDHPAIDAADTLHGDVANMNRTGQQHRTRGWLGIGSEHRLDRIWIELGYRVTVVVEIEDEPQDEFVPCGFIEHVLRAAREAARLAAKRRVPEAAEIRHR